MLMLQLGTLAGQGEGGERVWFSIAVTLAYGECIDVKVRYLYQPVWKKKKTKNMYTDTYYRVSNVLK